MVYQEWAGMPLMETNLGLAKFFIILSTSWEYGRNNLHFIFKPSHVRISSRAIYSLTDLELVSILMMEWEEVAM